MAESAEFCTPDRPPYHVTRCPEAPFKTGDEVWVTLQMPYNTKPQRYPGTVMDAQCPDTGEDRPRFSVRIMDGREFHGVDPLLIQLRREVRNG